MDESPSPVNGGRAVVQRADQGRLTRLAAILVLIPTLPMLAASAAALALFYVSPARFERLLARLPGDELIRSVLFFAPVTLFGVVVLALLYALEKPGTTPAPPAAGLRWPWSTWALVVIVPLLILAGTAWAARFIAPGRFSQLIDPLPGTTILQWSVTFGPLVLFLLFLLVLVHRLTVGWPEVQVEGSARPERGSASWSRATPRLARLGAGMVLIPALPMLLLSVAGVAVYLGAPDLMASIVVKLSQATVLRLGLLFTPIALLALVLLAGLVWLGLPSRRSQGAAAEASAAQAGFRGTAAVGVLVGGLMLTVVLALGIVGAMVWLLVR